MKKNIQLNMQVKCLSLQDNSTVKQTVKLQQ